MTAAIQKAQATLSPSSPTASVSKGETDKKISAAVGSSTPPPLEADLSQVNANDITRDVNEELHLEPKLIRDYLQREARPTTLRRISACIIVAVIVACVAIPWLWPAAFGEAFFGYQIAATIFGGSVGPLALAYAWKLGIGGTPYQNRINAMRTAFKSRQKLEKYVHEVEQITRKYDFPEPVNKQNYQRKEHYQKAMLALICNPSLYELLHDTKNEKRKGVDDVRRRVEDLGRRRDLLENRPDKAKELEEVTKNLKEERKSLARHEEELSSDEESVLRSHGFTKKEEASKKEAEEST